MKGIFFVFFLCLLFSFCPSCDATLFPVDDAKTSSGGVFISNTDSAGISVSCEIFTLDVVLKDNAESKVIKSEVKETDLENVSYVWFVKGERQKTEENSEFLFSPPVPGIYQVDVYLTGYINEKLLIGVGSLEVRR